MYEENTLICLELSDPGSSQHNSYGSTIFHAERTYKFYLMGPNRSICDTILADVIRMLVGKYTRTAHAQREHGLFQLRKSVRLPSPLLPSSYC